MNDGEFVVVEGGVVAPRGFTASGVACGVKGGMILDLGLLVNDGGRAVGGTFTRNRVRSPAVRWSEGVVRRGRAKACVVNSGNANACTGERGEADARRMAELTAELLGVKPEEVVVASTGVIGVRLPMKEIEAGIEEAHRKLGKGGESGESFARAIMTTDSSPKEIAVETEPGVRIGACAKGAGMIAPNMATMLCFITTDAVASSEFLAESLRRAVSKSFNRISVDGHTSTNDTAIFMASGESGVEVETARESFQRCLDKVTMELALKIVEDGEGATRVLEIQVEGTETDDEAERIARAIACSPLVKTAVHGGDPNWGRIISAVGMAYDNADESEILLFFGERLAYERGCASSVSKEELAKEFSKKRCSIRVVVGEGGGRALHWTSDLTKKYIEMNAEYTT